jgi:hypothetical protein
MQAVWKRYGRCLRSVRRAGARCFPTGSGGVSAAARPAAQLSDRRVRYRHKPTPPPQSPPAMWQRSPIDQVEAGVPLYYGALRRQGVRQGVTLRVGDTTECAQVRLRAGGRNAAALADGCLNRWRGDLSSDLRQGRVGFIDACPQIGQGRFRCLLRGDVVGPRRRRSCGQFAQGRSMSVGRVTTQPGRALGPREWRRRASLRPVCRRST